MPDWKCQPPVNREKESKLNIIRVGVDLAKNVFQVHGIDRNEKPGLVRVAAAESVMGANDTVDVESALRVVRQTLDSADRIE